MKATTYEQWRDGAMAHPRHEEAQRWRNVQDSSAFDAALLVEHTEELARARESGKAAALTPLLQEALYRHLGELEDPNLYAKTPLGTKHVVEAFYTEALACVSYLANPDETGVDPALTLAGFERAAHIFGRSALVLSGGATLGFFHLGVVKALSQHNLLPNVISGASMSALIACGTGARTDAELTELFENPRSIRTDAIKRLPSRRVASARAGYDPAQLADVVAHNNGDFTFDEAFKHSGRTVSISISPTRHRQKPRVLCHLTSPHVLMNSAAVASAAIPGVFPSAKLEQRDASGQSVPYMGTETWIDGSILPIRLRGKSMAETSTFIHGCDRWRCLGPCRISMPRSSTSISLKASAPPGRYSHVSAIKPVSRERSTTRFFG